MIAIEYAFAFACVMSVACMVIIELKPNASDAFRSAFGAVLMLALVVLACVLGFGAYDALRGVLQ